MTAGPSPAQAGPAAPKSELVVDWSAFLPEGVTAAPSDAEAPETGCEERTEASVPGALVESSRRPDPGALDRLESDLDAVDAALLALDAGTYGVCQTCGERVGDGLLEARPTRTTCPDHDASGHG